MPYSPGMSSTVTQRDLPPAVSEVELYSQGLGVRAADSPAPSAVSHSSPTVVVVGRSPSLRNRGLGLIIDSHDEVIRINTFSTFPPDTGEKTTRWIIGLCRRSVDAVASCGVLAGDAKQVWVTTVAGREPASQPYWERFERLLGGIPPLTFTEADLGEIINRQLTNFGLPVYKNRPSTGLWAIALAHRLWPDSTIDVAGFYNGQCGYYESPGVKVHCDHDYRREGELIDTWVAEGWVRRIDQ